MKQLILIVTLLLAGCSHHEHNHSHGHEGATLNQGQKWKPDETLRSGMNNIHDGLVQLMKKESGKKALEKDYLAFYDKVQSNTQNIITKCEMSTEMDQTYHVILEEMLDASEKLRVSGERQTVSPRFVKAFHKYQEYFDQKFTHH